MVRALLVACAVVLSSGCSGASTAACGGGRTELDGVCVSQDVADYVACVRAQGAKLGKQSNQKLSAEASTAGVKAAAASDVSDTLERSYAASDANALEVIRTCKTLHDRAPSAASASSASNFGVFVASKSTGDWGFAVDRPSAEAAVEAALPHCGAADCKLLVWFRGTCAAIARGQDKEFYWAWGAADRAGAEVKAADECAKHTAGCAAVGWACTSR